MSGWIYLIRNGELYKIGITKHINNRIRQLKPDEVLVKSFTSNNRELENFLHRRYNKVRIPQTEYFRLNSLDIRDCKRTIMFNSYFNYFILRIFFRLLLYMFIVFTALVILNYLLFYDWKIIISNSINWTEKASFLFMVISLIKKSGERLDFFHEFRFRIERSIIYLVFSLLLNLTSQISQYYFLE